MLERDRKLLRRRLDEEMMPFRKAGRERNPTDGLLRAVREALRIPLAEIAEKSGVGRSTVNDLERRERRSRSCCGRWAGWQGRWAARLCMESCR